MKDEDVETGLVFNESVEFLFVYRLFNWSSDEFLLDENDLSTLETFDETRDVIKGGIEESFPILEHV